MRRLASLGALTPFICMVAMPDTFSIFRTPWQSIVSSMESLGQSHSILAQKIESDVERPLKEYQTKNREMQAMSTIQGNLAAVAKDVDGAHKRASKLNAGKSSANKVANATSDVEAANQQWDSQAPYVFEQLQALDESRVNHLRDALTQLETHEVDLVERNRITAESCLNAMLNVETSDEISTFVARFSAGGPSTQARRESRSATGSSIAPSAAPELPTLAATPSRTRAPAPDDRGSDRPSPFASSTRSTTGKHASTRVEEWQLTCKAGPPPSQKSSFGGLRRLGTVLGRQNKGAKGMERPPSPDKRSRPTRNPLRRGPSSRQEMQAIPSPPETSTANLSSVPPQIDMPLGQNATTGSIERTQSPQEQRRLNDRINGDSIEPAPMRASTAPMTNGLQTDRDLATVHESQAASPTKPAQVCSFIVGLGVKWLTDADAA